MGGLYPAIIIGKCNGWVTWLGLVSRQMLITHARVPLGRNTGGQRKKGREKGGGRRNRTQPVSSINRQTTAKEYRSIQGLASIL